MRWDLATAGRGTVKGAGRRASRVLAAALSAIALSDDAAGSATTGPLTANGETETHAHGFVALALSYAVPLLARVLPEAYIFVMYFFRKSEIGDPQGPSDRNAALVGAI